jgi:4-hydroxymandelate oxidase
MDGIVVSNHRGRQLDGEIAAAISGNCVVLPDGGIRSGGISSRQSVLDLLAVELRDATGLACCEPVSVAGRLSTRGPRYG